MRLVSVDKITPDMELAYPIYSENGRNILLNSGCTNLNKYVDRLKSLGINYVRINDEVSHDIKLNYAITDQTRIKSKIIIAEVAKNIASNKNINFFEVKGIISDIINDILNNEDVLYNLADIRNNDDYTFAHSVNVTVISLVIAKLLGYNHAQMHNLGTGALLHDVGKALIPPEILNKPGKLTNEEFEIMKEHPILGFGMVKDSQDIGPLCRIGILTHHEKFDGTGYPNGLKGMDIHKYGRIISIADVFDALSSDRIYRKKWPIYQVIEYISQSAGTQFDANIVNIFIQNVSAYPNGTLVILSTGDKGIVQAQNKDFPTRPVVKVIQDKEGNILSPHQELDLVKEISIVIVDSE